MQTIFIIHGMSSSPDDNWFPWIKKELEKLGRNVYMPRFPTPDNQLLENWIKVFNNYKKYINKDTIFIGHSLGAAFILSILENLDEPVKATFFISGFTKISRNLDINRSFTDKNFKWDQILINCKKFFAFYSENDEHITLEEFEYFADRVHAEKVFVKGGRHLNKEAKYTEFCLLLEKIKKEL